MTTTTGPDRLSSTGPTGATDSRSTPTRGGQRRAPGALPTSWPGDLAAMALLLGVGVLAFSPVFDGTPGLVAAGGGALLGALIALVGAFWRWSLATVALATVVGYYLFGGLLAIPETAIGGVLPGLETIQRLTLLTWQSWRDLLTVSTPASAFTGPAVVPYFAGLVAAVLAVSLALRARHHLWALLPTGALLATGILWGTKHAPFAAWQGGLFALTVLLWGAWRQARVARGNAADLLHRRPARTSAGMTRMTTGGLVVALCTLAGLLAGVVLTGSADRHVLRDDVVPPLDLRSYASPLTTYRYLERDMKAKELFTVQGLPEGGRVRLATLDAYDGNVYKVADSSAGFLRVGPKIDAGVDPEAPTDRLDFTIANQSGVWLPAAGKLRGVRFTSPRAKEMEKGLHYNPYTGTALTTVALQPGDRYEIDAVMPTRPSDNDLAKDSLADAPVPDNERVPEILADLSTDYIGDAETPQDKLRRIERRLSETGFYSNGSDGRSRAGHTNERISSMLGAPQLIGDDEQYAVAMALMARHLGIPARVVMGFYPSRATDPADRVAITGNDAHVWVEVAYRGAGWVAYDPTPDRDRIPQTKVPRPRENPKPQVLPPPDPPKDIQPPRVDPDTGKKPVQEDDGLQVLWTILKWVAIALLVVLLLALPFLVVAALRRRRRTRRLSAERPVDRLAGGWAEVVDTATDLGTPVLARRTRGENARELASTYPGSPPTTLATEVDRHVFGGVEPSDDDVARLWAEVDAIRKGMTASVGRRALWRYRLTTRSLRRPSLRLGATGDDRARRGLRWPRRQERQR